MDLSRFPRRRYTPFPTPLEPMPRFSQALAASCPGGQGPELWVKRDDMLGLFPGGNKTRKLEFLVADALAQGADTLITCGAPQSNHCRITLAAAVKEGLKCRFVIEERVPHSYNDDASGNHFMFRLMGVEGITVVPGGSNMAQAMQAQAEQLLAQGRRGYIIPGGGSNAIGGLGYAACAQELQQQCFDQGVSFDRVVVGSGSSGTHGGLLAGFLGNHIQVPIVGVGVSRDPADQEPLVHREAQAVLDLIGIPMTVPREAVVSVGGYWSPSIRFRTTRWWRPCSCWRVPKAFCWTRCTPAKSWRVSSGWRGKASSSRRSGFCFCTRGACLLCTLTKTKCWARRPWSNFKHRRRVRR